MCLRTEMLWISSVKFLKLLIPNISLPFHNKVFFHGFMIVSQTFSIISTTYHVFYKEMDDRKY